MKQFKKHMILFIVGGMSYYFIEVIWRGYSHFSMMILGGICFVLMGLINEFFTFAMPLWKQQLIATCIITTLEFITGYILNIKLSLNIWDYSNLIFNLMGQICLLYSVIWYFLSVVAIILDDYLRYWLFDEEKPHYNKK